MFRTKGFILQMIKIPTVERLVPCSHRRWSGHGEGKCCFLASPLHCERPLLTKHSLFSWDCKISTICRNFKRCDFCTFLYMWKLGFETAVCWSLFCSGKLSIVNGVKIVFTWPLSTLGSGCHFLFLCSSKSVGDFGRLSNECPSWLLFLAF